MEYLDRRTFVRGTGSIALAAAVAGCGDDEPTDDEEGPDDEPTDVDATESDDGDNETDDGDTDEEEDETDENDTEAGTDDEATGTDDADTGSEAEGTDGADEPGDEMDEHLDGATNYDGTVADLTGQSEVVVEVGDPEGGTDYRFDPAAAEVDRGTTVTWEWIDSDPHSVTQTDGDAFDSGVEEETEFEYTPSETGLVRYHCIPHRDLGMRGALRVV